MVNFFFFLQIDCFSEVHFRNVYLKLVFMLKTAFFLLAPGLLKNCIITCQREQVNKFSHNL